MGPSTTKPWPAWPRIARCCLLSTTFQLSTGSMFGRRTPLKVPSPPSGCGPTRPRAACHGRRPWRWSTSSPRPPSAAGAGWTARSGWPRGSRASASATVSPCKLPRSRSPPETRTPTLTIALENVVRWVSAEGVPTWEPAKDDVQSANGLNQVYEGLTQTDADLSLHPALATSWTLVRPDLWRFELRQDAHFHDGTPLTTEDVVFSLARAGTEGSD